MPKYEYSCTECGERLEVVQKFADDPLTDCPVCGGRLRKLFSAVGVVFKGSGFYRTDSRTAASGGKSGEGSGSGDAPKNASGETSTSESKVTKPALKPSSKGAESAA